MAANHPPRVAADTLEREVLDLVHFLCESERAGHRVRLPEATSLYGKQVSLDLADYVKFLRRYRYVLIHRADQSLLVTDEGRRLVDAGPAEGFEQEVHEHFAEYLEAAAPVEETVDMPDDPSFDLSDIAAEAEGVAAAAARASGDRGMVEARPRSAEAPARAEPPPRPPRPEPPSRAEAANRSEATPPPSSGTPMGGGKGEAKYTRYDALGSGGIGTVYRGRVSSLALDVAIKEIKELFTYFNFLQRSEVVRHLREAVGQMALLDHPNIIHILDQNTEVAHPFFVMEYLPGGNLRTALGGKPMELDRACCLFAQMCYALRFAHAHDVIHGNLKPENVLLDAQGNIRLSDFGMTRLLSTEGDRAVPRVVTGAIGYLAPEQMAQAGGAAVATDVYAMGILLYEMLTGTLPGRRSPLPSQARSEVPKAIDELFDRATRDDPTQRHTNLDAMLDDFYRAFTDKRFLEKGRLVLFAGPGA